MSRLDIFKNVDPLLGIKVQLPRHCQCGHDMLHVGPGGGPHRASLHCALCGDLEGEVAPRTVPAHRARAAAEPTRSHPGGHATWERRWTPSASGSARNELPGSKPKSPQRSMRSSARTVATLRKGLATCSRAGPNTSGAATSGQS
jgi:hypothetical protein